MACYFKMIKSLFAFNFENAHNDWSTWYRNDTVRFLGQYTSAYIVHLRKRMVYISLAVDFLKYAVNVKTWVCRTIDTKCIRWKESFQGEAIYTPTECDEGKLLRQLRVKTAAAKMPSPPPITERMVWSSENFGRLNDTQKNT